MSITWSERTHYIVPLYDFMAQETFGKKRGAYVYGVSVGEQWVYAGQTTTGARTRLWKHVSVGSGSGFGSWIIMHEHDNPQPTCHIVLVDGDLNAAERYYISRYNPELNKVRYKEVMTVPPVSSAEENHLTSIPVHRWRGVITYYLKRNENGASIPIHVPEQVLKEIDEADDDIYTRLYARAYRDPNHPDLRKSEH